MKVLLCCILLSFWVPAWGQNQSSSDEKAKSRKAEDFICEIRPREIAPGEVAVLQWSIKGATKVVVQEAPDSHISALRVIGEFEGATGKLEVRPKESTTYVILCEGSTTYVCASTSVRVRVKPQ
jgi:hypothetical protein